MLDFFENYVRCDNINFKYARGVSDFSGKEFHLFYEIVLYLEVDGELITESSHTKIKPQTIVAIPKETYHQFIFNGDPSKYCRCVFQFYETEANKDFLIENLSELIITDCSKSISYLFEKMKQLSQSKGEKFAENILQSVLTLIIDEIKKSQVTNNNISNNALTIEAIKYISENLRNNICIEKISQNLKVSPSTLMHTFRKNMNTSIHKYITMKRLILAHNMIESGEPAQNAAYECGFNDYSGFYKQYKKMFDIPPSKSKLK